MSAATLFFALVFAAADAAAITTSTTAPANITLLTHASDARTWFGSVSVALRGATDPVLMATSWVFAPEEIVAYRPSAGAGVAWRTDTSAVTTYQTLYIASASAVLVPTAIDALAFWNLKPRGIVGDCVLVGFRSDTAPDLTGRAPGSWRANVSSQCQNINGWMPFTRFALSRDGATAIAWVQDGDENVTVYAYDGQTGRPRWTRTFSAPPAERDYVESFGAELSEDGRWVTVDFGVVTVTPQALYVLDATTGVDRCPPVESPGLVQATLSPDGEYIIQLNNAFTGTASILRFNDSASGYVIVGTVAPPPPPGAHGWTLGGAAMSSDGTTTYAGFVWYDSSLAGTSVVAMWSVANLTGRPHSFIVVPPVEGDDIAVASASIACDRRLCAAALWVQVVNGTQPSVVVLSADAPIPVMAFTSPGSMDNVDVVYAGPVGGGGGGDRYYVAAAGCATYGVCTAPGSDAYLWEVVV